MKGIFCFVLAAAAIASINAQSYGPPPPQRNGGGGAGGRDGSGSSYNAPGGGAGAGGRGGSGSTYSAPNGGAGAGGRGGSGSSYSAPSGGAGAGGRGAGGNGGGYSGGAGGSGSGDDGSSGPAQYSFQYDVNDEPSGNNFGHQESRDGPRTEGKYYVQLPDTRLMTVEYYVDETGYHPTITFEGEAQFPDDSDSSAGGYSAPSQRQPSGSGGQFQQPSSSYQQPSAQQSAPSQQYGQPGFGK